MKWLLSEDDSALAVSLYRDLNKRGIPLLAPPHLLAEVTSAIYKRYRVGELDLDAARRAAWNVTRAGIRLGTPPRLAERAIEIAAHFGLALPYDAFYLALGEIVDCEVWTADAAFFRRARADHPRLRLLSDFRAS